LPRSVNKEEKQFYDVSTETMAIAAKNLARNDVRSIMVKNLKKQSVRKQFKSITDIRSRETFSNFGLQAFSHFLTRVTGSDDFLLIGLLFEAHYDFLKI
jgi:hypothetical protein